jgi:hypothetical protein
MSQLTYWREIMSRQEELKSMSDLEINILVAGFQGLKIPEDWREDHFFVQDGDSVYATDGGFDRSRCIPDYCNNPADIMPIAIENGIQQKVFSRVNRKPEKWWADDVDYKFHSININPLRAICIVFILMSESK